MFSITSLTSLLLLLPLINACATKFNPCNRRSLCGLGTCTPSEDCLDFKCTCPPGFSGKFCEHTNLPSCGSNSRTQCMNGGTCHNILSGFVCQCPKGFYGFACEFADPSVPENWGVPSIEEDDDLELMMDIPEGWKRVDDKLIVVTKISTLNELKSQLSRLFEEIRNFTNVRLEFSKFEDGEEFIHGEDCSDDTQKCQYTANLFALVPENETDISIDYVMSLLMNPVFPNHLNPEELHVDDNTGKDQKPLSWTFIGIVGVVVGAMMVIGSFGGLLHTSRGRPFKYGTTVKKAPLDLENAVPSPQMQHLIQLQIHAESKLKLIYSGWELTPEDQRFIRTYRTVYGDSVLHMVARAQSFNEQFNIQVAGNLIQMGVDVNAVNKQGSSPMETAVLHNQTGLAKFFMDNQADIVLQNPKNGYTILTAAISMKNVNFVKDILALPQAETLLNMATKSDYPQSPLTLAVNQGQMEILKSILDCMIKKKIVNDGIVNPKMKQVGYSALHYAALEGSVESARLILDYEKNSGKKNKKYVQFMDREDYQGQTPLQTAVVCKWLNVIKFLLEAGSDPNHKDLVGKSAYNLAEESKDEEFKRQFDEICAQTGAPKKVVGGKKRTYQALIQPDVQPIPKQSRPNQVDTRRISVESGIASADSSFSSTCSPSSAPQIQPYLPQFGNWNQPGYDFSQFNSYQNMNYGFGMQGNGQMNSVNGLINTPVAAGTYGNLGLPSLYQNNLNFNSNLFPAMTMNPLYQSPSATTLTPNSQICPQAAYSSPTTLNIPQSSQSPPQAISSHSNSPQVLSPANLVQNPTQNYQSQYPYPSSNYSMNMQMTGSQMNLDQTGHMKSQHTYLSSQMSLNTWSNSNQ